METIFVEPVTDLAVLGVVDGQVFPAAADAFEDFCSTTEPVRLAIEDLPVCTPVVAYVFTHNKDIVPARVQQVVRGARTLVFEAAGKIKGGTSGGPVVTSRGRLLSIVSHDVAGPRIAFAAPIWLLRQMVSRSIRRKVDDALPPGRRNPALLRGTQ